jgi:hypothetical protein
MVGRVAYSPAKFPGPSSVEGPAPETILTGGHDVRSRNVAHGGRGGGQVYWSCAPEALGRSWPTTACSKATKKKAEGVLTVYSAAKTSPPKRSAKPKLIRDATSKAEA